MDVSMRPFLYVNEQKRPLRERSCVAVNPIDGRLVFRTVMRTNFVDCLLNVSE